MSCMHLPGFLGALATGSVSLAAQLQCWHALCYTTLEYARHDSVDVRGLKLANAIYLLIDLLDLNQSQLC